MDRWQQYGVLGGLLATCFALGLWGFRATGGAIPYAKRFSLALQRGAAGSGSLVDLARGVVVAGPIRKGGLVGEYAAITLLFVLVGVGLYVYVERNADHDVNHDANYDANHDANYDANHDANREDEQTGPEQDRERAA